MKHTFVVWPICVYMLGLLGFLFIFLFFLFYKCEVTLIYVVLFIYLFSFLLHFKSLPSSDWVRFSKGKQALGPRGWRCCCNRGRQLEWEWREQVGGEGGRRTDAEICFWRLGERLRLTEEGRHVAVDAAPTTATGIRERGGAERRLCAEENIVCCWPAV